MNYSVEQLNLLKNVFYNNIFLDSLNFMLSKAFTDFLTILKVKKKYF